MGSTQAIPTKMSHETGRTVSFQLVSDVHTEMSRILEGRYDEVIVPKANHLLLAGDIGTLRFRHQFVQFLKWCSANFQHTYMVAGNHEYYHAEMSMEQANQELKKMCEALGNVTFMEKTCVYVEGVRLLGTTLWSHTPPESVPLVSATMNDYRVITAETKTFTVADGNKCFLENKAFLERYLLQEPRVPTIVMTHHAPLFTGVCEPFYLTQPDNIHTRHAFATDMSELMPYIDTWVFGHTHYCNKFEHKGCTIYANQLGYQTEHKFQLAKNYQKSCIVDVVVPDEATTTTL